MTMEKRLPDGKRVVAFKLKMDMLKKGFQPISSPPVIKNRGRLSKRGR